MKILIAGYYGFGNLGDELILSAVLSQLKKRIGAPAVTVLSADCEQTKSTHHVRAVSRWDPLRVALELWRSDFLILGGGGLLQNKTSNRSLLYYLGVVAMARLLGCPVVLYALGIETLSGKWTEWLTRRLLNNPNVTITVRDEASKRMLVRIGLPGDSVHVTADPVFSREKRDVPVARYPTGLRSALLIPRFPCPRQGQRLFALIGRILRDERKMHVSGLLFQPAMELPYVRAYNGERVLSEDDFLLGLSLEEMTNTVADYDWIISARFHGLVLAALAGRSFIGVGDPHKVGRLCDLLHMPFLPWDADEGQVQEALIRLARQSMDAQAPALDQLRAAASQTLQHVRPSLINS